MPSQKPLFIAMTMVFATLAHADETTDPEPTVALDEMTVTLIKATTTASAFDNTSDKIIRQDVLKKNATTLGDALSGELGIHSNQFGGGASAPIIRGQEGKRIKVLQNNSDVIDMAHLSPDHATMVDTTLAKQVEIVRGVSTLLYSSGNSAGAVNVVDSKIPKLVPDGLTGEAGVRHNTGNDEKLATGSLTMGRGNFALHIEGLHKSADDYRTPTYSQQVFKDLEELETVAALPQKLSNLQADYLKWQNSENKRLRVRDRLYLDNFPNSHEEFAQEKAMLENQANAVKIEHRKRLAESWADSKAGSIGLSWVGDKGYIGMAVSERKDKYGLPAHNHLYEGCGVISIFEAMYERPYLARYPQLINESDVNYINPRPDCAHLHNHTHTSGTHGINQKHSDHSAPYIDLTTRRYDVRGEWDNPIAGVAKVRGNLAYVDYQHDEKEADITTTSFKNKGKTARFEITHEPSDKLTGVWGVQYTEQDNSAISPQTQWRKQPLLTQNKLTNTSIFGLGQYQWGDVALELGTRLEKQKVAMDYDTDEIEKIMRERSHLKGNALENAITTVKDATAPHQETAYSYALGVHWQFAPKYTLSLNASHQERLPNPQELYTHGMHLATNSFEIGNRHLTKEKSNNVELTLKHQGDKLDYQFGTYVYDFDNYIYLQTLNEHLGMEKVNHFYKLRINRYSQSAARFYGLEGNIGYQVSPTYHVSVFGDYVKGRLTDLPDVITDRSWGKNTYAKQDDRYTPRMPPMRAGVRAKAEFDDKWSGNAEFIRTFDQEKVSKFETPTKGHNLLNLGLDYHGYKGAVDYSVFFKANNLLNSSVYAHETFLPYIPQMGRNFMLGVNVKF